jgi:hypothetical protein
MDCLLCILERQSGLEIAREDVELGQQGPRRVICVVLDRRYPTAYSYSMKDASMGSET